MRRLDLQALADERLQPARGAVERVALGHVREGSQPRYDRRWWLLRQSDGVRRGEHRRGRARTGIGADTLRKWGSATASPPGRTSAGSAATTSGRARVEWLRTGSPKDPHRGGRRAAGGRAIAASRRPAEGGDRPAVGEAHAAGDARRAGVHALRGRGPVEESSRLPSARRRPLAGGRLHRRGAPAQRGRAALRPARRPPRRSRDAVSPALRGATIGLLALAVLLQADGWLAVYLGADTPLEPPPRGDRPGPSCSA